MPVRATVEALPEPGHAILRVSELDAAPDGLALSIQRQQGPDSHLADDGWRRTEAWLLPARVERRRDTLEFHLGPEICDRLAGIATVRVRVKEPDIGVVGTTVVAWPAMLTSGALDPARRLQDETVRLRRAEPQPAPAPPPEPEPAPEPPAPPFTPPPPRPELRASRALDPRPEPSGRTGWLIAALVLVAIAGGGYHVYTTYFQKPEPVVAAAPPAPAPTPAPTPVPAASAPGKSVRDIVGEYLATKPTPEAMLAKARDYAKAGDMGAAFLVFRRAAETGNAPAQIELAAFYDPLSTPPKAGFTADGPRAADWYERAALAGSTEAQRKLGLLLAKGGGGLPPDPGKAKTWLQQAAAQNDADAKKALDALPK
jgi:hypothetical protein